VVMSEPFEAQGKLKLQPPKTALSLRLLTFDDFGVFAGGVALLFID
jgi:hypothetical protein